MSTATRTSAVNSTDALIVRYANQVGIEPNRLLDCLKKTVFKTELSNEEVMAFLLVAERYQLNPFFRELIPMKAKDGTILPTVSVDGWLNLIHRQKNLDGVEFRYSEEEVEFPVMVRKRDGAYTYKVLAPVYCECVMFVKNLSHPIIIREYFEEVVRGTENWAKYPRRMLRHRALIQCARVAFSFGNIYDADEVTDMDTSTSTPTPISPITALEPSTVPALSGIEAVREVAVQAAPVEPPKPTIQPRKFDSVQKRDQYVAAIIDRLQEVNALDQAEEVFGSRLSDEDYAYAINKVNELRTKVQ